MKNLMCCTALFLFLCSQLPAADHPNVVLILADDLGWSDTTLYGTTTYYQTPHVDRLAKRGMTFTRAYSASPLCSPTRSAILTGLSPARTGITTPNGHLPQVVLQAVLSRTAPASSKVLMPVSVSRLKTDYPTLPRSLKAAGYATAHFGKWHLGADPYSPLQHGFDVDIPHWHGPGPAGSFVAPWKFPDFKENVPGEHIEDRMAAEAVAWMTENRDRPFFLNYWQFSVHAPFDAKKELIEKHRARVDPTNPQRSPTYAAMIESFDDAIGTLLDALDRLQLSDNTIVILTSDNGGNMYNTVDGTTPTSNAPLRGGKATLFEGGVRVPCVVAWPGVTTPGSRSDAVIQSEDFYPTLLDGLGLKTPTPQTCDGVSILSALKGGSLDRRSVFHFFPHNPGVPDWLPPGVTVHHGEWKLIRLFHGGDNGSHRYLLFNLQQDPGEKNDLAEREPDRVRELDQLIDQFLAETKAVVPVPNPAFNPAAYRPELEGQQKAKAKTESKGTARSSGKRPPQKSAAATDSDAADPALQGWKARGCTAQVNSGILHLKELGNASFLGFGAGRHRGPGRVRLRIRAAPGNSHLDWLPNGPAGEVRRRDFALQGGDWQDLTVETAATGPWGIVRLYVPQQPGVQIDWIELSSMDGQTVTRTDF